jgi:cyclophilin family peptidyl-prolyl cis-trans isomerase
MKHKTILSVISILALFGAGCGNKPVIPPLIPLETAIPVETQTPPTAEETQPENTAATSTDSLSTATTTAMTQDTLAFPGILPEAEVTNKIVRIKTTKGEIVFELLPKEGPKAASNFVYLANKKFYDNLSFHRVVPGFVIQGGDPNGNGTGGPGYKFEDDVVNLPYSKGIVAMANAGPNTNGSQFFIMLADNPLPPAYSVFGRVISGQEIVDKIVVGDIMTEVTVENKK